MTAPTRLSIRELSAINWIEQYYHSRKGCPPVGEIKERYPDVDLDKDNVRLALHNRGIEFNATDLTDEQVAALLAVTNYADRRGLNSKLKQLGITTTQWNAWLKNPEFKNKLHRFSTDNFEASLDQAHAGLMNGVAKGDTQAVKLYLELTGRLTRESQSELNLKIIIARLIESIQRHVDDPVKLAAIERDFEVIVKGGNPLERTTIIEQLL